MIVEYFLIINIMQNSISRLKIVEVNVVHELRQDETEIRGLLFEQISFEKRIDKPEKDEYQSRLASSRFKSNRRQLWINPLSEELPDLR